MKDIFTRIHSAGLLPVVKIDNADDAYTAGGLIEIGKGQVDHEGQLIFSVPSFARALAFLSRKSIPVLTTGKTGECVLKKQQGGFKIKVVERELK